jgi:hypothetical protein
MRLIPRFTLKTLLLAIALVSIPLAWSTAQLRWIHERQAFREAHEKPSLLCFNITPAPWPLRIFGERGYDRQTMYIEPGYLDQAKDLFPEVDSFHVVGPDQLF